MKRGDWVKITIPVPNPNYPPMVHIGKLVYSGGGISAALLVGSIRHYMGPSAQFEPTVPSPAELARWRRHLKTVGLALIQEKASG